MMKSWKNRIIDTALILIFFAVMTAGALLITTFISPAALGDATQAPRVDLARDCTMVKTPAPGLRQKLRHLESDLKLEVERQAR